MKITPNYLQFIDQSFQGQKTMTIQKAQVLLVEHNADRSWLAMRATNKHNREHELIHFDDGENLLKYLDTNLSLLPKLILLDIHLPKKNGLEVLRLLKENPSYAYIPVIMLISAQQRTSVFEMYVAGATSYIVKPLTDLKLTETLINLDYLMAIATRRSSPMPD